MSPMSIKLALLTAGAAIALCFSSQAQAGDITKSFQFSASGFPAEAPQQEVTGTFTFTYDDAGGWQKAIVPDVVNLTINGVAYTPKNTTVDVYSTGVLEFDTFPDNEASRSGDLDGTVSGKDAFALAIDRFDSQPTVPGKPLLTAKELSVSELAPAQ